MIKKLKTNDNSYTFFSETYSETYHSTSGAIQESLEKFIKPSKLKDNMLILDIGFGIGYNAAMALHHAKVKIISLEKDKEILQQIKNIEVPDFLKETYKKIKIAAESLKYKDEIKIILGDATKTIKTLNEKFDVVFLDAFSPKKNPELWTESFFKDIKSLMKPNAILTTYSCAGHVRRKLKALNFEVFDGPKVGRRSPSTMALNKD